MTKDKVLEVLKLYKEQLQTHYKPIRLTDQKWRTISPFSSSVSGEWFGEVLDHVLWMCDEIPKFDDLEKIMRWLGYIQGVLHVTGHYTLDELREQCRTK